MIIAEIGSNWKISEDDDDNWCHLIDFIKKLDFVDIIKFQFWDTNTFIHPSHPGYATFKEYEFPSHWYKRVFNLIGEKRFMSTCFDIHTADQLKKIGQTNWKIASGDITNLALIKHIAKYKDTMYISTGNATYREIFDAYLTAENFTNEVTIMHCISKYPVKQEELAIGRMLSLKKAYRDIGFSSHLLFKDMKNIIPILAVKNIDIIEIHVKNKVTPSPDYNFSHSINELKLITQEIKKYNSLTKEEGIPDQTEKAWSSRDKDGLRPLEYLRT